MTGTADPTPAVAAARRALREHLAGLLPAHMRNADAAAGGVLDALVDVLAGAGAVVADDLDQLGDDWFIETCAERLVPYIGDLIGVRGLHDLDGTTGLSNRARVADTIAFRRRKGTAAVLEDLARVTSGWPAKVTEFFSVLATTQHLDHVRLGAPGFVSVRDGDAMERIGTPFESACRTADVRPLGRSASRGVGSGHNIAHVGVHVWPLASYPLDQVTALAADDPPAGRYVIDPLGRDRHLAGPTVADLGIADRATEASTPGPLRRRPLHDELDAQRAAPVDPARLRWFQPDDPALVVWIAENEGDALARVPLDLLHVCDLSEWDLPTGSKVRVDPVLGRVTVAAGREPHRLAVSWSFARAGRIGAGPWPRDSDRPLDDVDFLIGVEAGAPGGAGAQVVGTLADAVAAWHDFQAANPGRDGRIVITDSHRYAESFTAGGAIVVAQGGRLEIIAGAWPQPPGGPPDPRAIVRAATMATIAGDLTVVGTGAGPTPGGFVLEGVLVGGTVTVASPAPGEHGLGTVLARSCSAPSDLTGATNAGALVVEGGNDRATVSLDRCLWGPLVVAGSAAVSLTDSVLHHPGLTGPAVDAPGADVTCAGATVIGTTTTTRLVADDTIFDGTVTVARRQEGCLRYCYVAPGSLTPRRYRCQPDLGPTPASRQVPQYLSLDPLHAGYARLAPAAAEEVRTGAATGAEMGAYRTSLTPQRLANLAAALDDYLPFGRVAAALPVLPTQGDQP